MSRTPLVVILIGIVALIYIIASNSNDDTAVVVTTVVVPPDLEQIGVDLQDAILADGVVSRHELEQAVEAMATCLESHGLTGVKWWVDDDGEGWGYEYESSDDEAGKEVISNLCFYSYVDRVLVNP